jgi:hypothetical protein
MIVMIIKRFRNLSVHGHCVAFAVMGAKKIANWLGDQLALFNKNMLVSLRGGRPTQEND